MNRRFGVGGLDSFPVRASYSERLKEYVREWNKLSFMGVISKLENVSVADTTVVVELKHDNARLPEKANPTDCCFDLYAPESQVIAAGDTAVLDLGISIELEEGWEAQIRGRSGMAKRGLLVHPGTIDHLYRETLKVIIHNLSKADYSISSGDRVAQMKIAPVWGVELREGKVTPTSRGGLGSTGR